MPIVAFLNIKGGVAKTTTSVAVAECLACWHHRVLLIDADHQAAASELLLGSRRLARAEADGRTLHDLFLALLDDRRPLGPEALASFVAADASDIESARAHLSVIPASLRLEELPSRVARIRHTRHESAAAFRGFAEARIKAWRAWLLRSYDHVVIDCPPSVSPAVRFALKMCDAYVVPSVPDWLSVRGIAWLQQRLRRLRLRTPALGTVWTLYREIATHHEIVKSGGRSTGFRRLPPPFDTVIPNAVAISRAAEPDERGVGHAAFREKYEPRFAARFENLCQDILGRLPAALRQEPPEPRREDRPAVPAPHLEQLFSRPQGEPFLAAGTPEDLLVQVLTASSADRARRVAAALRNGAVSGNEQRRLVEVVVPQALGERAIEETWGEDPALDAVRLRVLRAAPGPGSQPVRWEGVLRWAGRRVLARSPAEIPPAFVALAAASVAAAGGYRAGLEWAAEAGRADLPPDLVGVGQRLALGCAVEGYFSREVLLWLFACASWRDEAEGGRIPLLALSAYAEAGERAGEVHVASALASRHFRHCLGGSYRKLKKMASPPLAPPRAQIEALRAAGRTPFWAGDEPPWPCSWGGPHVPALADALGGLLGSEWPAHEVMADTVALRAALLAFAGHLPSALVELDQARETAPAIRTALRTALRSACGKGAPRELWPIRQAASRESLSLAQLVRNSVDPAVAVGTPHWLLPPGDNRNGLLVRMLQREGRISLLPRLRLGLNPQQAQKLKPYRLLPEAGEAARRVREFAAWLGAELPPPSRTEAVVLLDRLAAPLSAVTS